jgi:hypothetical protein
MKKKAKGKPKAGRMRSTVKDLAAKKSVKGGLLPAVRPSNLSVPAVQLPAVQLPAVQRAADGSV